MNISSLTPGGFLWAVTDVLPKHLLDKVLLTDWYGLEYQRLDIGFQRRREIRDTVVPYHQEVLAHIRTVVMPIMETQCGIKFDNINNSCVNWWLDEPGFRPAMHTDGQLPSSLQLYLFPTAQQDLGTTFFNTDDHYDVFHSFPSITNTGYVMLNAHTYNGSAPLLWHDMTQVVPDNVIRLSMYCWLGPYQKL